MVSALSGSSAGDTCLETIQQGSIDSPSNGFSSKHTDANGLILIVKLLHKFLTPVSKMWMPNLVRKWKNSVD